MTQSMSLAFLSKNIFFSFFFLVKHLEGPVSRETFVGACCVPSTCTSRPSRPGGSLFQKNSANWGFQIQFSEAVNGPRPRTRKSGSAWNGSFACALGQPSVTVHRLGFQTLVLPLPLSQPLFIRVTEIVLSAFRHQ